MIRFTLLFRGVAGTNDDDESPHTPQWKPIRTYTSRSNARRAMKKRSARYGFPESEYRIERSGVREE